MPDGTESTCVPPIVGMVGRLGHEEAEGLQSTNGAGHNLMLDLGADLEEVLRSSHNSLGSRWSSARGAVMVLPVEELRELRDKGKGRTPFLQELDLIPP